MSRKLKRWYRSRTVWVNAITALISALGLVAASDLLKAHPDVVVAITGLIIPALNVALRWLTTEPISAIHPILTRETGK